MKVRTAGITIMAEMVENDADGLLVERVVRGFVGEVQGSEPNAVFVVRERPRDGVAFEVKAFAGEDAVFVAARVAQAIARRA